MLVQSLQLPLVHRNLGLAMPFLRLFPALQSLAIDFGAAPPWPEPERPLKPLQLPPPPPSLVAASSSETGRRPSVLTSHRLKVLRVRNPGGVAIACSSLIELRLVATEFATEMATLTIPHQQLRSCYVKYAPIRGVKNAHSPAQIAEHVAHLVDVLQRSAPALNMLHVEVDGVFRRQFSLSEPHAVRLDLSLTTANQTSFLLYLELS